MKSLHEVLLGPVQLLGADSSVDAAITSSMQHLQEQDGLIYDVPTTGLLRRRTMAYKKGNVHSFFALSDSRPTCVRLVVTNTVCDKFHIMDETPFDFSRGANALKLTELKDLVCLESLARGDFGVYEKNEVPIQITDLGSIQSFGITFGEVESFLTDADSRTTYWWQRWGGILYRFTLDCAQDYVNVDVLAKGQGKYKPLPISLTR